MKKYRLKTEALAEGALKQPWFHLGPVQTNWENCYELLIELGPDNTIVARVDAEAVKDTRFFEEFEEGGSDEGQGTQGTEEAKKE